jgi:hypothetical protein
LPHSCGLTDRNAESRSQEVSQKADEERRRCRDWLLRFLQINQPKFLTNAELCGAAMRELKVSKTLVGWMRLRRLVEQSEHHERSFEQALDELAERRRLFNPNRYRTYGPTWPGL